MLWPRLAAFSPLNNPINPFFYLFIFCLTHYLCQRTPSSLLSDESTVPAAAVVKVAPARPWLLRNIKAKETASFVHLLS